MRNIQSLVGCSGLLFLMAWMMASCEETFTVSDLNLDLDNSTDFSCENNADCPGKLPYCSNEVCVSCDDADVEENSKDTGADCVCNKECKSNICLGQICVECHDNDIDYCGEVFRERNNDPDENPGNNGLTENLSFTCVNNTCVPSCDGENVTYCAKIKQCVKTDPQPEDACDDSCNVCQTGYACIGNQCKRSVDCSNIDDVKRALEEKNIDSCHGIQVYNEKKIIQSNGDVNCVVFCGIVELQNDSDESGLNGFKSIKIDNSIDAVYGVNSVIRANNGIIKLPLFEDIERSEGSELIIQGLNIEYQFEGESSSVRGVLANRMKFVKMSDIHYNNDKPIKLKLEGDARRGGLVGTVENSIISDVSIDAPIDIIVSGYRHYNGHIGGYFGYVENSTIFNLGFSNIVSINFADNCSGNLYYCGGLIGYSENSSLADLSFSGAFFVNHPNIRMVNLGGVIGMISDKVTDIVADDTNSKEDVLDNKYKNLKFNGLIKFNMSPENDKNIENIGGVVGRLNSELVYKFKDFMSEGDASDKLNDSDESKGIMIKTDKDKLDNVIYNIGGVVGWYEDKNVFNVYELNNPQVNNLKIVIDETSKSSYRVGGVVGRCGHLRINNPVVANLLIDAQMINTVGGLVGGLYNENRELFKIGLSVVNPSIKGLSIKGQSYVGRAVGSVSCSYYKIDESEVLYHPSSFLYIKTVNQENKDDKAIQKSKIDIKSIVGVSEVGGVVGNAADAEVNISGLVANIDSIGGYDNKVGNNFGGGIGKINNIGRSDNSENGLYLHNMSVLRDVDINVKLISGKKYVAGVIGYLDTNDVCNIYNVSTFIGAVSADNYSAGFISYFDSYYSSELINVQNVVGKVSSNNEVSGFIAFLRNFDKTSFKHVMSAAVPYRNGNREDVKIDYPEGAPVFNLWHFYKYYFNFKYNGNDPGEESRPSTYQTHVASFNDNVHFVSFLSDGIKPKVSAELVRNNLAEYTSEDYKIDWGLATVKFDGTDYQIPCFTDIGESKCENKSSELKQ